MLDPAEIAREYNAGLSMRQIAQRHHSHEEQVRRVLKRAGVKSRPRGTAYHGDTRYRLPTHPWRSRYKNPVDLPDEEKLDFSSSVAKSRAPNYSQE